MKKYNLRAKGSPPPGESLLSISQVCDLLNIGRESVKRLQEAGKLRPVVFNQRLIRYQLSEIKALIASHQGEG